MEQRFKLIADRTFYCLKSKRNMTQGVMFYEDDSERAVRLVSAGFASIVERPKTEVITELKGDKQIEIPVKAVAKPVVKPTKRAAKRKPVKK